ncbi:hypothetical protein B0J13DRAFT_677426 [Dactylonectria estremocensis]|uniref:Uncharacterized protein n=1 Tax=Dactylonectria estremocensis TaxID=1079267 RepID=A0A9P9EH66_9HYPO|nr:hypothetical protein B0J13DRAFT_677426 [Dactylonectria estremocensis]
MANSSTDSIISSNAKLQTPFFPPLPAPAKTLRTYRRAILGRKHLFAESDSGLAQYFIKNPIPHKHADKWKPVLYRGDNPKYTPTTKAIGRARRTGLWNAFRIELGDGVEEVLQNKRRIQARKWYAVKQKLRRWFWMKPTPPKKPLEDTQEVEGLVMPVQMRRVGFMGRRLEWEMGGETYTWTGTRRFLPNWSRPWKGISHDLKLVNSQNVVVATFEKNRWVSFQKAERTEDLANKKKSFLGTLSIYPSEYPTTVSCIDHAKQVAEQDELDTTKKPKPEKHTKYINLDGPHAGELTEETIVFTCWIAIEAEHRLRYKIFDLLQEIAEIVGG